MPAYPGDTRHLELPSYFSCLEDFLDFWLDLEIIQEMIGSLKHLKVIRERLLQQALHCHEGSLVDQEVV